MAWIVEYTDIAADELESLGINAAKRIKNYLDSRIATELDPRRLGHSLKGNLAGYWRYRVGDYRIICQIQDKKVIVLVLQIGHRKEIYKKR